MANYQNLKAAISAAIKTNGNQEITGQVLQDVLNSIVSVIGDNYTFAGVATPATNPGTPDQNVVYVALQAGTYTNFNGIDLPNGISLLIWNGTWTSEILLSIDDKPEAGSDNLVKSGGAAKAIADCRALSINNVIKEKIFVGKLKNGVVDSDESAYVTTDFIPLSNAIVGTIYNIDFVYGEGTVNNELELAVYDSNKNYIYCWYNIRTNTQRTVNIKSIQTVPSYYRASFKIDNISASKLYDYVADENTFEVISTANFEKQINDYCDFVLNKKNINGLLSVGSSTSNLLNDKQLIYGIGYDQPRNRFVSEPNGVISDFIWLGQFENTDSINVGGLASGSVCYLHILSKPALEDANLLDSYLINSTAGRTLSIDSIMTGTPDAKYCALQLQNATVQDYSNIKISKGGGYSSEEYKPVVIGIRELEEYGLDVFEGIKAKGGNYVRDGFSYSKEGALSTSRSLKEFFETPINRDDVSAINVRIHDTSTLQGDTFKLIVYAIYDSIDAEVVRLNPKTITGEYSLDVPMENHQSLYGIQFYNTDASMEYFTYDITVYGKNNPIETFLPSYYREDGYLDNKIKRVSDLVRSSIINGDAFYFITDTHWELNQKHSPAIIAEMEKYLSLSKIFHGGDVYHLGKQTDHYDVGCINDFRGSLADKCRMYSADGNHEFISKSETLGDTFAQSRIFLEDAVFGGEGKNYYYVDNKDKKLRYIILASFGPYEGDTITLPFEDEEQQNWIENTALNLESGWKAIMFTHTFVDANANGVPYFVGGGQAVANIIHRNNEKVLAVFEGHAHRDCVYLGMCDCPVIVTTCDMNVPFPFGDSVDIEVDRTTGTKNEQAFESVVFNKEENAFHLVRIGAGATNRIGGLKEETQSEERVVYVGPLSVGSTKTLPAIFEGETLWTSSANSVATVSNGIVTAVATGEVIICAEEVATGSIISYFIRINQ